MNPWEFLWSLVGWSLFGLLVLILLVALFIIVGVIVGLAKGSRNNITSDRKLKRKRHE